MLRWSKLCRLIFIFFVFQCQIIKYPIIFFSCATTSKAISKLKKEKKIAFICSIHFKYNRPLYLIKYLYICINYLQYPAESTVHCTLVRYVLHDTVRCTYRLDWARIVCRQFNILFKCVQYSFVNILLSYMQYSFVNILFSHMNCQLK